MLKNKKTTLVSLTLLLSLSTGWGFFGIMRAAAADSSTPTVDQSKVDDTQSEIDKIQEKLKKEQKTYNNIAADYNQVTSSLNATQAAIYQVQNLLNQTEQNINEKESEIKNLEDQQDLNRKVLSNMLQELYYTNVTPFVEVVLNETDFQNFINSGDNLFSTQEKVQNLIQEINDTKAKIDDQKTSLEDSKKDHEKLLAIQQQQKQGLVGQQADVANDLQDQEATVADLQSKLAELKSDLAVLTGKSYDATDIKQAVEDANKETGVPKGVLYGFLKAETNLGVNTGQCTYSQVKSDALSLYYNKNKKKYANSIALLNKRYGIFLTLVDDLGYSKSKKVSCTPHSYVGQGGAMGVAQFMGDIWQSYTPSIRAHTGHKTPDPWSLTDGVMAMAIKLKGAGATSDSPSAIKKASINYLGAYNANYYNTIYYWSRNYQKLF